MSLDQRTAAAVQTVRARRRLHGIAASVGLLACTVVFPARADDDGGKSALDACIGAHLMPADLAVVRQMTVAILLAAEPSGNPLASGLTPSKRDEITNGMAQLMTRLTETDCKAEVRTASFSKESGGAFAAMIGSLSRHQQKSASTDVFRAGAAIGIDIVKKLDSATAMDLTGFSGGPPADRPAVAPPPEANRRVVKAAVSGERLLVAFDTALNPDCSPIGKTLIRVLTKPTHGDAVVESGTGFTSYDSKNQRYHCNEKKSQGAVLYYASSKGYTGPDTLAYEVIYATGGKRESTVDITVN